MGEVLDKTALMDRIGYDLEFLAEALEQYDKDRLALMSRIREALLRRDGSALADAAHALSGLALNFSAKAASDAALRMEEIAEKGNLAGAGEALASLEDETDRLKAALQDILQNGRSSIAGAGRQVTGTPIAERPIRVITVDDQELVRNGVRAILLAFDDIELIGDASSGSEAIRLCDELRPDVVLMDVRMADMDGVAATRTIKRQYSDTQVLVLSVYHSSDLVKEAMQAGAVGYVMKNASRDELARAIRAAREGRITLSPEATTDLVAKSDSPSRLIGDDLTVRERQILGMLAKGMRNNDIAKQINKSPYTVRHYVSEVIAKLGANNRAEAAAIAVKHGLVD